MPTVNHYFNNFSSSQEQQLADDLIVESIRIYGIDMYYIPRSTVDIDAIYTEDRFSTFSSAHKVEMYIKNTEGFQGIGDILGKLGAEIRDKITFTVARRRFREEVGDDTSLTRPREGDVLYFPLTRKLYSIDFVEHEAVFYQIGALYVYDLQCNLFEYSNELFDTGIEEIDSLYRSWDMDTGAYELLTEGGDRIVTEGGSGIILEQYDVSVLDPTSQNETFDAEVRQFTDFSETNPYSEGRI